jgi:hypothetical protein
MKVPDHGLSVIFVHDEPDHILGNFGCGANVVRVDEYGLLCLGVGELHKHGALPSL